MQYDIAFLNFNIMRIAYIANIRMPTEKAHGVQIMKTCEALVRLGHDVELVIPNRKTHITDDPFSYYGIKTQFPIQRLPVWDTAMYGRFGFLLQSFTFAISVRRYLRRNRCDIIYSRDEHILMFMSGHYVWESHTGSWNGPARIVARRAKHLAVISGGLKVFYEKKGIPADHITVAHDGIDLEEFANPQSKEMSRSRLGLPHDKKIALYIGRLDGWKGTDTLLATAAYLPNDFVVAIIGGEPAQVKELSARYPAIRFLGFHPYSKLADNMSAADVLVLPNTGKDVISVSYTSPLKLFAYMTSGKPIVASDLPSIREILDERSAFLVPPDNTEALAQGIRDAVVEGNVRAIEAARVVEQYSWTHRAERVGAALRTAIST